jgi:hypothetical protein
MEKKISPICTYLVSVKSKNSNNQGKVYVVSSSSLAEFIAKNLTPDVVLLIDTIDTFGINL